ncbi:MAG: hypothetical protein ACR2NA_09825, partial [Solirubrobacterales bacterium]
MAAATAIETAADADRWLASREAVGWKLGLHRIQALLAALGEPHRRFDAIHVVGTNGKTSVSRMTAAVVAAGGIDVGVHISPHRGSWAERVLVGGRPLAPKPSAVAAGNGRGDVTEA